MIYLTLFQSFDYYSKSIHPIEYILIEHFSFAVNFCCPLALVFFLLSYNLHANRALGSGLCLGSLLTALCADGQRVVWPLRVIIVIIIVVVAVVVVVIGGVCFILTSFGCAWALLAFAVN